MTKKSDNTLVWSQEQTTDSYLNIKINNVSYNFGNGFSFYGGATGYCYILTNIKPRYNDELHDTANINFNAIPCPLFIPGSTITQLSNPYDCLANYLCSTSGYKDGECNSITLYDHTYSTETEAYDNLWYDYGLLCQGNTKGSCPDWETSCVKVGNNQYGCVGVSISNDSRGPAGPTGPTGYTGMDGKGVGYPGPAGPIGPTGSVEINGGVVTRRYSWLVLVGMSLFVMIFGLIMIWVGSRFV